MFIFPQAHGLDIPKPIQDMLPDLEAVAVNMMQAFQCGLPGYYHIFF